MSTKKHVKKAAQPHHSNTNTTKRVPLPLPVIAHNQIQLNQNGMNMNGMNGQSSYMNNRNHANINMHTQSKFSQNMNYNNTNTHFMHHPTNDYSMTNRNHSVLNEVDRMEKPTFDINFDIMASERHHVIYPNISNAVLAMPSMRGYDRIRVSIQKFGSNNFQTDLDDKHRTNGNDDQEILIPKSGSSSKDAIPPPFVNESDFHLIKQKSESDANPIPITIKKKEDVLLFVLSQKSTNKTKTRRQTGISDKLLARYWEILKRAKIFTKPNEKSNTYKINDIIWQDTEKTELNESSLFNPYLDSEMKTIYSNVRQTLRNRKKKEDKKENDGSISDGAKYSRTKPTPSIATQIDTTQRSDEPPAKKRKLSQNNNMNELYHNHSPTETL
eukprot:256332_1